MNVIISDLTECSGLIIEEKVRGIIEFNNWPVNIVGDNDETIVSCENETELRNYLANIGLL